MPIREVKPGDDITAQLLNDIASGRYASGVRASGGISVRQDSDGQTQIWSGVPPQQVFFCIPSGAVSGATGTFPNVVPISFNASVYQVSGATQTLIKAGAIIYNWYPSPLATSKFCMVAPDGSDSYVVVAQSCT